MGKERTGEEEQKKKNKRRHTKMSLSCLRGEVCCPALSLVKIRTDSTRKRRFREGKERARDEKGRFF